MRNFLLFMVALSFFAGFSTAHAAEAAKEWTFLVYLNGNNSLDSYGPYNLNEMEKVGSTDKVNVVVQWASYSGGTTKRLLVKKDSNPDQVTSPVIQDMGKVDMGDYKSLVEFIRWGVANFPAQHYFVNVWDHGGGWHLSMSQFDVPSINTFKMPLDLNGYHANDISWDDNSGNFISTKQLGQAMNEAANIIGHKVDVYASDACLMAMPEVAAEMANSVAVYAGSEETEPAAGWPYDGFLSAWNSLSDASPVNVAKALTETYVKSYENGSHGTSEVTFSAFDMSALGAFEKSMTDLGTKLGAADADVKAKIKDAMYGTQSYAYSDYGDVVDFVNNLQKAGVADQAADKTLADTMNGVVDSAGQFVLINRVTKKYSNSHGVSVWLPSSTYTVDSYWNKYKDLNFQNDTHWGDALKAVLQ